MKSKVVIAATDRKELAEISQILQQSYDVFCFCDISSLTEFIKDNRNAIIPLIASAAFLKKKR